MNFFYKQRLSRGQRNCLRTAKKEYPKSVTGLLRLEEKRFLQGFCYFINNIPIFISNMGYVRKVKVVVLIINSILSDLSQDLY
jgi:hypothetical protein